MLALKLCKYRHALEMFITEQMLEMIVISGKEKNVTIKNVVSCMCNIF